MSDKPVDIIMFVGEQFYSVGSFIREAERMGVSKRIPRTAIPEGIVPGQSRILIKHRQAILHGHLDDLVLDLAYVYDIPEAWQVADGMLHLVMFLEDLRETNLLAWEGIVERYELTWTPGVIGYSYITSIFYIAHENEERLPEDLQNIEGIEIIREIKQQEEIENET